MNSDPSITPTPQSLLAAWASRLSEGTTCERLSERSYVFRVRAHDQNFILKEAGLVNPQNDVPRKLAADAAVLRHLQTQGVGVAVPEPTDDGQPYLQRDGRCFTLCEEVPSAPDERAPLDRVYRNTGAAIARLHRALACYPGPIYSWRMDLPPRILDEAVEMIPQNLDETELGRFRAVLEAIRRPVTERLDGLPSQYIHGDCHGGNIMRVGEEVSGFIDLDHLPFGPRIYDPCYLAANEAIFHRQDPAWTEAWFNTILPCLFCGYAQEIPITEGEKDAAPYMMLGILLIMVGWFFKPPGNVERALGDLKTYYWIYENLDRLRASLA